VQRLWLMLMTRPCVEALMEIGPVQTWCQCFKTVNLLSLTHVLVAGKFFQVSPMLAAGSRIHNNTSFFHNLQIGPINYNVCPWQAFPTMCKVTLNLIRSIRKLWKKKQLWIWPQEPNHKLGHSNMFRYYIILKKHAFQLLLPHNDREWDKKFYNIDTRRVMMWNKYGRCLKKSF
jgi:hypothetical protein